MLAESVAGPVAVTVTPPTPTPLRSSTWIAMAPCEPKEPLGGAYSVVWLTAWSADFMPGHVTLDVSCTYSICLPSLVQLREPLSSLSHVAVERTV